MRTFAVLALALVVALIAVSEARPFGGRGRGNRKGGRDQDSDGPECPGRCPRPTRQSRVCAFTGDRERTFPSACLVDRIACNTKRNITVVSEGPCPRPRLAAQGGRGRNEEDESEEDISLESSEEDESTTTSAPTNAPSSEPATTARTDAMTATTAGSATVTNTGMSSAPSNSQSPPPPASPSSSSPPVADPSAPPAVSGPGTTCVTTCNSGVFAPVCGTDGSTYASACVLEAYACANGLDTLTVAREGECVP